MSRRELREQIFKFLFRVEFNDRDEMEQQKSFFFDKSFLFEDDEFNADEKSAEYISQKSSSIIARIDEIDGMINDRAKGWTTQRMGKVDLTIIRLAIYEIMFDDDVPKNVAINEAVELAKKFGQDESSGFVNGVLAKFV